MSKKISTSSTIKPRTKNWTDEEDDCLVGLFKTQFEAGNLINGVWHKDALLNAGTTAFQAFLCQTPFMRLPASN